MTAACPTAATPVLGTAAPVLQHYHQLIELICDAAACGLCGMRSCIMQLDSLEKSSMNPVVARVARLVLVI